MSRLASMMRRRRKHAMRSAELAHKLQRSAVVQESLVTAARSGLSR